MNCKGNNNLGNKNNYILFSVNNITLGKNIDYFQLGNFILCNYKYFHTIFPNVTPKTSPEDENSLIPNPKSKHDFILYSTNKNTHTKKFEKEFSDKLNTFVDIMLYINGKRTYTVEEYWYLHKEQSSNLCVLGNDINFGSRSDSFNIFYDNCKVSKILFKKIGNNIKLFKYIDSEPNTEIEKKIKLSVLWIALGLRTNNLTQAYVCLCIALETLLSGNNSPLERGTAYQLREFGAFLASAEKEERIIIQEKIKNLYDIRCKISHSGTSKKLSERDFYELLKILKAIIDNLFKIIEEKEITNHKKLQEYIDEIKFQ